MATRDHLEKEIEELRANIKGANTRLSLSSASTTPSPSAPQVNLSSGSSNLPYAPQDLTQLLQQQQQLMTMLTHLVSTNAERQQLPAKAPITTDQHPPPRPWKLDIPALPSPGDVDLTSFADWKLRLRDYMSLT